MIHSVDIAFFIYIFQTFEARTPARTRANQANITGLGSIAFYSKRNEIFGSGAALLRR